MIKNEAKEEASRIKKQADEDVKNAVSKAKASLHDEIVNIALDASKEVLSDSIDENVEKKLVDGFEKSINEEK